MMLKLGMALFDRQDAICDALNNLHEMKTKEWQRCVDARDRLERQSKLEMATRFTGKTVADFENEEMFIKAGDDAKRRYLNESKVKAAVGVTVKEGLRILEDNAPVAGVWSIDGGRYYLDKPIRLCETTKLFIKDAEIHFGKNGWFELDGGEGGFWNCRFVSAEKMDLKDSARGAYMITGKTSCCCFMECEFSGDGNRAAVLMDGNVSCMQTRFNDLYSNRAGGAIVGSRYDKNDRKSKISINLCSFANCKSENLSIFWARQASIMDSEFVSCGARWSIITVVEDTEFDLSRCVFDDCAVADGGMVVSIYSNGGSSMANGDGINTCWLKNCHYQYAYHIGIPISSTSGWVDEATYKGNFFRPTFLRDGSPLSIKVGVGEIKSEPEGGYYEIEHANKEPTEKKKVACTRKSVTNADKTTKKTKSAAVTKTLPKKKITKKKS